MGTFFLTHPPPEVPRDLASRRVPFLSFTFQIGLISLFKVVQVRTDPVGNSREKKPGRINASEVLCNLDANDPPIQGSFSGSAAQHYGKEPKPLIPAFNKSEGLLCQGLF